MSMLCLHYYLMSMLCPLLPADVDAVSSLLPDVDAVSSPPLPADVDAVSSLLSDVDVVSSPPHDVYSRGTTLYQLIGV